MSRITTIIAENKKLFFIPHSILDVIAVSWKYSSEKLSASIRKYYNVF
jgi:hypothetical protein